jgi:hypothetical protein
VSNNPPYISLELSKDEAEWLYEKLYGQKLDFKDKFDEICSMSSSNPLAKMRSALTMKLAVELENFDTVVSRFTDQQPDLKQIDERLDQFKERMDQP